MLIKFQDILSKRLAENKKRVVSIGLVILAGDETESRHT